MSSRIKNFISGDRRKTLPLVVFIAALLFLLIVAVLSVYDYKVREVYGVSERKFKTLDQLEDVKIDFEVYTIYDVYYNADRDSYSNGYFYYKIYVNDVEMDIENLRYQVMFDCDSFKACSSEISKAGHNEIDPYDTAASFIYFNDSYKWSRQLSQTNRMRSCEKNCENIERYTYDNFKKFDILPMMYIKMEYDHVYNRGQLIEHSSAITEYIKVSPSEYIVESTNFY